MPPANRPLKAEAMLSLILSTFERPDALTFALDGIGRAAVGSQEVIVADDGSGPETAQAIEAFARKVPFPVIHERQEHRGFRLAAIRNKAIRASRGEVLVFLDGDCIPDPAALRLHAGRVRPGRAHTGARVLLQEEETGDLLAGGLPVAGAFQAALRRDRLSLRSLWLKNILYRSLRIKPRPKLVAANCAVHRADLERVNGFDERFEGWGFEDDDLARRLRRGGVSIADGTRDCLALHLFHKVHASHRPDSRSTPNALYFRRNCYLQACRRGLRARPLEEIRIEWIGDPPRGGAWIGDISCGSTVPSPRPEVSLLISGTSIRRRPRGELVLEVPPAILGGGKESILRFLEQTL